MPPRLPARVLSPFSFPALTHRSARLPPPFLLPLLSHSRSQPTPSTSLPRYASILSSLRDRPGAIRHKRRVGRGPSSSKGGKSGRGHKGQKQKGGKIPKGFEGGQTRQAIVNPEGGFKNLTKKNYTRLNLDKLHSWIKQGRIDPKRPITVRELKQSRAVANVKDGVKLLAGGVSEGSFPLPIQIVVSRASAQAIAAIESAGGKVWTRYYTPFAVRQIMKGKMDPVNSLRSEFPPEIERAAGKVVMQSANAPETTTLGKVNAQDIDGKEAEGQWERRKYLYRLPDPTKRSDIEYYRDPAHRGYLAHTVPEGESPSLFWKVPKQVVRGAKEKTKKKSQLADNRLF